ncbi:universal stress protein [Streptomyces sp. NPDC049040]|uniref:universal stress protein n=1 Tax=Streptomyces sp. NPDC049040 TaxID=3365593 RepID=UPI0037225A8F
MTRYVVVGMDGSDGSRVAVRWAAKEAAARGLALRLVTVAPSGPWRGPSGPGHTARGERDASPAKTGAAAVKQAYPDLDLGAREFSGKPAEILAEVGQGAEVLVVGTRGTGGFDGLRLGSVALEVAGRALCSVVLVPPEISDREQGHELVVGVDARHPDDNALGTAFREAGLRGARLRAVHAWDLPSRGRTFGRALEEDRAEWEDHEVQLLDDALHGWRQKHPEVSVLPDVRSFGAADALVRASAGAELLVVGRGPRHAVYLGGVTHAVAHHTHCPLMLAHRH